jgi:RNA polymerase sigma-70 factor, ECF subfamily
MAISEPQHKVDLEAQAIDWEAIYDVQMPRIFNFFRYRLGDEEVAKDLTSTTFTKAWRARDQYRMDLGAFEAWLFTIARNVANDFLRKLQRRKEVPLDALWGLSSEQSVEQEAQQRREFARLEALVQTLPVREQEIIALKYGAGMTNRAIALALDISESNIGTIHHRTVNKLRKHWHHNPHESRR